MEIFDKLNTILNMVGGHKTLVFSDQLFNILDWKNTFPSHKEKKSFFYNFVWCILYTFGIPLVLHFLFPEVPVPGVTEPLDMVITVILFILVLYGPKDYFAKITGSKSSLFGLSTHLSIGRIDLIISIINLATEELTPGMLLTPGAIFNALGCIFIVFFAVYLVSYGNELMVAIQKLFEGDDSDNLFDGSNFFAFSNAFIGVFYYILCVLPFPFIGKILSENLFKTVAIAIFIGLSAFTIFTGQSEWVLFNFVKRKAEKAAKK
ncbi:hypothetical protein ADUPG1_000848 [Aduncisulcus paluster]|uniref:Uncharacterized protein n=1 Tax=Aduncisulcus paluster TaxID=2918883 RepID=A0ABQ5K889_9EUKA|nr:hypothetical protein ADUPG1_000848 [Aduncisulcus paluster]|eukprot:gnl/Carplike_NY0171/889_a1221_1816.p1 GENE.gnl/Carplike_NY0171/889_a1221_1816~~gnl/Carplike_NY0171/889_a1221_1816.p1  ORF type:complete len:263 (-),score=74.59 gnl/Carplike_NY0171/889_a1221_1816:94-882(-)